MFPLDHGSDVETEQICCFGFALASNTIQATTADSPGTDACLLLPSQPCCQTGPKKNEFLFKGFGFFSLLEIKQSWYLLEAQVGDGERSW